MKHKWLKILMLAMMATASFGSPMNPKEIEELMHIMNQTRIEFTVPNENDKGDGADPLITQVLVEEAKLKFPTKP